MWHVHLSKGDENPAYTTERSTAFFTYLQALMEAIKAVTEMNQDLSVEKIEIQTNAERV